MQSNSLESSHSDSETGTSANPAPGLRGRPLHIAWGILRNLPKIMNVLPPFRPKALQQLRERLGIPTRTHETRQPFDLSPALATKVRKYGLEQAVQSVRENGFGQIHDLAPMDFTAQLRDTVWRIANAQTGGRANMLLDKDPIFEKVALNPKILTMVEVMCGQGALLSQVVGRVINQNTPASELHVTQNQLPAPFPKHNQMVTFCWACDEQTKAAGAIKVVAGSQQHRRPPSAEEITGQQGAAAIECPAGSVSFWDGSVWHGRGPRTIDGEQVLLYVTFCRLALRPLESYDHLDARWLAGKSFDLRVLLGREDGMDTAHGVVGSIDNISKFLRMTNWAKT